MIDVIEKYSRTKGELRGEEVTKNEVSRDKAQILVNVFGKRFSVVYDLATITDLIGSANEDEDRVVFLSNLLYFSLAAIYQSKDGKCFSKEF